MNGFVFSCEMQSRCEIYESLCDFDRLRRCEMGFNVDDYQGKGVEDIIRDMRERFSKRCPYFSVLMNAGSSIGKRQE